MKKKLEIHIIHNIIFVPLKSAAIRLLQPAIIKVLVKSILFHTSGEFKDKILPNKWGELYVFPQFRLAAWIPTALQTLVKEYNSLAIYGLNASEEERDDVGKVAEATMLLLFSFCHLLLF